MKPYWSAGAAFLISAVPAAASPATETGRWEVRAAHAFCYASLPASSPGRTLVSLAVDTSDRVFLILANPAWSLEPDANYAMALDAGGRPIAERGHVVRIGDDRYALSTDVTRHGLLRRLGNSPQISLRLDALQGPEVLLDRASLEDGRSAVSELLRCADRLERRRIASTRERLRHLDSLRGHPSGPWISPRPPR